MTPTSLICLPDTAVLGAGGWPGHLDRAWFMFPYQRRAVSLRNASFWASNVARPVLYLCLAYDLKTGSKLKP